MKKYMVFLALSILIAGTVFAQEDSAGRKSPHNWISGEVNLFGAGFRYDYAFNPSLSLGMNAYYSTLIFFNEAGADATIRLFPGGKAFFLGLGVGYHYHAAITGGVLGYTAIDDFESMLGFAVTPDIGFRINPSRKGGFFLSPGIKVPITIARKFRWIESLIDKKDNQIGVGVGVVPYIAFGGAF